MAEHTRLDITNSEQSNGGTSVDPNVPAAIENAEAEQVPAAGDDLDNSENSLSLSDNGGRSEQLSQAPSAGNDLNNYEFSSTFADNSGQSEQSSDSKDIPDNIEDNDDFYLELQEANNISKAAYKELMTIAVEAKAWVVSTPALGSLEEFLQMFRSPPPPGKRTECSIQSAVVPIDADVLVSIMMDADRWASCLSHIVSRKSVHFPPVVLRKLGKLDEPIKSMLLLDAEFQLPTPLFKPRKFCFWRCLRRILPDVQAIVDISRDYFPGAFVSGSENICRKRPSGLLVRGNGNCSEVIWIENVEIPEVQSKDGIDSGLINSNLAFSAKRWVDALRWKLQRNGSRLSEVKMEVNKTAEAHLLNLTETMRKVYLDIVSETPDKEKWVTLSNKDVRILRNASDHADLGLNNYIAVTSFRLHTKPISVIDFLVKKNMDIQWPRLLNAEEPEEVIRFASPSNCISLHKKRFFQDERTQDLEYLLQETSNDGFCFFVTSSPISKLDVNSALSIGSSGIVLVQPSGFAVMPDGPDGFNSNASLVTFAIQQQLNVPDSDQAIQIMCDLVNTIIKEISDEVSRLSNTPS